MLVFLPGPVLKRTLDIWTWCSNYPGCLSGGRCDLGLAAFRKLEIPFSAITVMPSDCKCTHSHDPVWRICQIFHWVIEFPWVPGFEGGYNFLNLCSPRSGEQAITCKYLFKCCFFEKNYIFLSVFFILDWIKHLSWAYQQPEMNSLAFFLWAVLCWRLSQQFLLQCLKEHLHSPVGFCGDSAEQKLEMTSTQGREQQ